LTTTKAQQERDRELVICNRLLEPGRMLADRERLEGAIAETAACAASTRKKTIEAFERRASCDAQCRRMTAEIQDGTPFVTDRDSGNVDFYLTKGGKKIRRATVQQLQAERDAVEEEASTLAKVEVEANGAEHHARKALEAWLVRVRLAKQLIEEESTITPEEREVRERREMQQETLNAQHERPPVPPQPPARSNVLVI